MTGSTVQSSLAAPFKPKAYTNRRASKNHFQLALQLALFAGIRSAVHSAPLAPYLQFLALRETTIGSASAHSFSSKLTRDSGELASGRVVAPLWPSDYRGRHHTGRGFALAPFAGSPRPSTLRRHFGRRAQGHSTAHPQGAWTLSFFRIERLRRIAAIRGNFARVRAPTLVLS